MAGRTCACALISFVTVALGATTAHAELGGAGADIAAEASELGGELQSTNWRQYGVAEIDVPNGVLVREYLDHHGLVFAVTWRGPAPPDLRRLLGTYFADYSAGLAGLAHPGLERSVRVARAAVIVEAGGHLRAYAGRAYLPALLPPGVTAAEFR